MIVQRMQDTGVQIFRTDNNDAITVRVDGHFLSVNYMIQQ